MTKVLFVIPAKAGSHDNFKDSALGKITTFMRLFKK
jgi:hypothetical protein